MALILISLLFISAFSFLGLATLSYAVFLWEKKKVEQLTKDIVPYSGRSDEMAKRSFSNNTHSNEYNNYNERMNISTQLNQYFERTLVVVKQQNYKNKLQKIFNFAVKVSKNLGFYLKLGIKYILKLSKIDLKKDYFKQDTNKPNSGLNNNFNNQNSHNNNYDNDQTEDKQQVGSNINLVIKPMSDSTTDSISNPATNPTYQQKFTPNNFEKKQQEKRQDNQGKSIQKTYVFEEQNIEQSNQNTQSTHSQIASPTNNYSATIGMVDMDADYENTSKDKLKNRNNKDEIQYEKIENSILKKLQETGLNNYNTWLELANHYQKYQENEKAKEIYAMVLKHAQGKEKEMAMNGLIALN